jgi:hypothetical protein
MDSLENLYCEHKSSYGNPLCQGCSILSQSKPQHTVLDYETISKSDVLFLSESYRYRFGKVHAFTDVERETIKKHFPYRCAFSTAIKCPSVKEVDMSPDNMKICRTHLEATIDAVKPILVFACGNLAMKMLIKKSGITNKRGKAFEYSTTEGHSCVVIPIFHPYSVIKEPRHEYLFEADIKNGYEKYVLGKKSEGDFSYGVLMSVSEVEMLEYRLKQSNDTIAVDIETTGLNFLTDSIQTIAISSKDGNWVIPLDHKDSPFIKGTKQYPFIWKALRKILENPNNRKVFHNAKFDLKFLVHHGIYARNVWDTKIMHHLINENVPKSLMDLVKLYFPGELEDF